MSHRCLAAVSTVISVIALSATPAAAQTVPRTPWGQPDLQGIWNNSTLTPLERPEELADKEFLTDEEAANLEQETIDRNERRAQALLNILVPHTNVCTVWGSGRLARQW